MKIPELDLIAVERELCGRSLVDFVRQSWHVLEPGQKYIHGWHVEAVCEHLEAITTGELNRLLINIPPGTMKSTLVSVFWPAWEWGPQGMPHLRYIGASHEQGLAIRDAVKMRRLVESDWYQRRWPLKLTGDQNEKKYYENVSTGFREARAVKSMTGRRGDRVTWDDPHSIEGGLSEVDRETATRVFQETLPTRLNNPDTSAIVIVMQRIHEADISGFILDAEDKYGYEHLCLPMEFEKSNRCVTSIGFQDPRTEEGELLFPGRFPEEVVERDKLVMGEVAVAGQFQQRPSPRHGSMFKPGAIEVMDAAPAGLRPVRGWDLAATKDGGDWTVGFQLAVDEATGITWFLDLEREQGGPDEVEQLLVNTTKRDGRGIMQSIPQDPAQAGRAQAAYLSKKLRGFTFEFTLESGDKTVRASPLASQMNVGNVKMVRAPWNKTVIDEFRSFPRGKYDDIVDGASRAYNKATSTRGGFFTTKR